MKNIRIVVLPLALAAVACSHTKSAGSKTEPAKATASASASASANAAGSSIDPKMLALTKPILSCKYERKRFVHCKALRDFRMSRDAYFDTDAADQALFDMLTGDNEKLAIIAAKRLSLHNPQKVLADKAHVERLLATVERPKNHYDVEATAVRWLSKADFNKLGLTDRLEALAKNPDVEVRRAVAFGIIDRGFPKNPSEDAEVKLVGTLLQDKSDKVIKRAAMGLSNSASPGSNECKLLKQAVKRADDKTDSVVWAAGSARCKGLAGMVINYVDKRTSDPTKITNAFGLDLAQAVQFACRHADKAEKKKGYAVGVRMTSAKVPDPNTRYAAMSTLVACDQKGAKAAKGVIARLAKDKDSFVSRVAKEKLKSLSRK